jgi:hypothetical protein
VTHFISKIWVFFLISLSLFQDFGVLGTKNVKLNINISLRIFWRVKSELHALGYCRVVISGEGLFDGGLIGAIGELAEATHHGVEGAFSIGI